MSVRIRTALRTIGTIAAMLRCTAIATLLCALATAPQAAAPLPNATGPCRLPGIAHEVQCGRLQRPLDPSARDGVAIDIHYAVVPAVSRGKAADPVFLIAGGPGQSAIDVAPMVMPLLERLNRHRDIVFVDQRGTGRSAPLKCDDDRQRPLAEQADLDRAVQALHRCRERLVQLPYGDLRFFTTPLAAADLDAVRASLGASRVNLVAASYGTRVALDYARQFPRQVRRMVLDGAAPPDMALPSSMSRDAEAALDAMFRACEQEPACIRAHPKLRDRWGALLQTLPRRIDAAHPLTGRREAFTLSPDTLLQAVRRALYVPAWASALPSAMDEAAEGRFDALFGLASLSSGGRAADVAMGMHFSVACSEDVPLLAGEGGDAPGTTLADAHAHLYARVCERWPRAALPAGFRSIPSTQAPVLVLSGGLDPATPPRHGERVARALGASARHVVVQNAGHGVLGVGCIADVVHRFIAAGTDHGADAAATDARCAAAVPRPPAFRPVTLEGPR